MIQSRNLIYGIHILGMVLIFGVKAFGQTSQELSCKVQAKEVALQTYQSCVTEARKEQIDTLRKEYSAKLAELKDHYNNELKKAAGKEQAKQTAKDANGNAEDSNSTTPSADESKIELKPTKKPSRTTMMLKQPSKSLARMLPKKQSKASSALPVSTVSEDVKVIPAPEDNSIETAASQMNADGNQGAAE